MKRNSVIIIISVFGGLGLLVGISVMLFTGNIPEYPSLVQERLKEFLEKPGVEDEPLSVAFAAREDNLFAGLIMSGFWAEFKNSVVSAGLRDSFNWQDFAINLELIRHKTGFEFAEKNLAQLFAITKYAAFYEIHPLKAVLVCECDRPDTFFQSVFGGKMHFKTTRIGDVYLFEPDDELNIWFACAIDGRRLFISTDTAMMRRFLVTYLKSGKNVEKTLGVELYMAELPPEHDAFILTGRFFRQKTEPFSLFGRPFAKGGIYVESLCALKSKLPGGTREVLRIEDRVSCILTAELQERAVLRAGDFYGEDLFSYSFESAGDPWHSVYDEFLQWLEAFAGGEVNGLFGQTIVRLNTFDDGGEFPVLGAAYVIPVLDSDKVAGLLKALAARPQFGVKPEGDMIIITSAFTGAQMLAYGLRDGLLFIGNSPVLVERCMKTKVNSLALDGNALKISSAEFAGASSVARVNLGGFNEELKKFINETAVTTVDGGMTDLRFLELLLPYCSEINSCTIFDMSGTGRDARKTAKEVRQIKTYMLK